MPAMTAATLPPKKSEDYKYTDLARLTRDLTWASEDLPDLVVTTNASPYLLREEIASASSACHARARKIQVQENASLVLLHLITGDGAMINQMEITLAAQADVHIIHLHTGTGMARTTIHVELNGPGASFTLNGAQILSSGQHGDVNVLVRHVAPHTTSRQAMHSVVSANGTGVFQGKIRVEPGAVKADANQISRAVLLGISGEMDTKPELEIYADDVQCSHGATTGALDDDQLFYLTTRGIPPNQARVLLLQAFIAQTFASLDEAMQNDLTARTALALDQVIAS